MTKSATIRALAKDGLSTAEIARRVGVRYQHAYNVLKNAGIVATSTSAQSRTAAPAAKPALTADRLFGVSAFGTDLGLRIMEGLGLVAVT